MKIAHLSDLHISSNNQPRNLKLTHFLLEYVLEEGVDHIVITGDLTDFGAHHDFIALRRLFEDLNLLNPFKLSLVIGNHDIFGRVQSVKDIFTFAYNCTCISYVRKVNEFVNYFGETFENIIAPPPPRMVFPYIKPIGDVIFLGMNSIATYSKIKNFFASKGMVYRQQLRDIVHLLSCSEYQTKKKIALIHHSFSRQSNSEFNRRQTVLQQLEHHANRLQRKKALLQLFKRNNIEIILHGHEHESCEYWIDGLHFMNAGGCIDKNIRGQLNVNFINILRDEIYTEIRIIDKAPLKNRKKIFADTWIVN